ncbi:MAG: hypothetical protein RLZZ262_2058, partial [Bacteroidota bacterium]
YAIGLGLMKSWSIGILKTMYSVLNIPFVLPQLINPNQLGEQSHDF